MKIDLQDLIVVIPGIMGSMLHQNGKPAWAVSMSMLWKLATSWGGSFRQLQLRDDPLDQDLLNDGVVAVDLLDIPNVVSGLISSDGYGSILSHITSNIAIQKPNKLGGNFFKFPYDWRRDNRVAARQLERFVDRALTEWRSGNGGPNAKVIFITHSMGGLVARYYLECRGGWRKCKALVTLGTPHRGSPKALDFLVHGFGYPFHDFSNVVRSFTSIYQLLPTYPCLRQNNAKTHSKVTEVPNLPGVDPVKTAAGLAFHDEINQSVEQNLQNEEYRNNRYALIPFVGIQQPTVQSGEFDSGKLTMSEFITLGNTTIWDGDGTVPRVSAIPKEVGTSYLQTFLSERHAFIQSNPNLLIDLLARIENMQQDLSAFRGGLPEIDPAKQTKPAMSVRIPDFTPTDAIEITMKYINFAGEQIPPHAILEHIETSQVRREAFTFVDDQWRVKAAGLIPGLYHATVDTSQSGPLAPDPIHDVFEVKDPTIP